MRTLKQKSKLQEEQGAKLIGGRRVRGSGSVKGKPGDGISSLYMDECKYTDKKSISVKRSDLLKLEENSLSSGKMPVFMFGFSTGDRVKYNWVAVPEYLFREVMEQLERIWTDKY